MGGFVSRPKAAPAPAPAPVATPEPVDTPQAALKRRKLAEGRSGVTSTGVSDGGVASKTLLGT